MQAVLPLRGEEISIADSDCLNRQQEAADLDRSWRQDLAKLMQTDAPEADAAGGGISAAVPEPVPLVQRNSALDTAGLYLILTDTMTNALWHGKNGRTIINRGRTDIVVARPPGGKTVYSDVVAECRSGRLTDRGMLPACCRVVMNTVCTLWLFSREEDQDQMLFTARDVAQVLPGCRQGNYHGSSRQTSMITGSLQILAGTTISVDGGPAERLLELQPVKIRQRNGIAVDGYLLSRAPVLYTYATSRHMYKVEDRELLEVCEGDSPVRMSVQRQCLELELYLRLHMISSGAGNAARGSRTVNYARLFSRAGIPSDEHRQVLADHRRFLTACLRYWQEYPALLSGWQEIRRGNRIVGVEITPWTDELPLSPEYPYKR